MSVPESVIGLTEDQWAFVQKEASNNKAYDFVEYDSYDKRAFVEEGVLSKRVIVRNCDDFFVLKPGKEPLTTKNVASFFGVF